MTDGSVEIVNTVPVALPKSTTPDDLLAMYDEIPAKEEADVQAEANKQIKVKEEIPKLEAAKELAKAVDSSDDGNEERTGERDGLDLPKTIKAKHGEKELDIPEEATLTTEINGKTVEFKVSDAIKAYHGQEKFNRDMNFRASTVGRKEKALEQEYSGIKAKALDVVNAAITGDIFAAIRGLAKVAAGNTQLDIVGFEKQYLDQIEKMADVYAKLNPKEREAFFAKREAEALKEELKKRSDQDSNNAQAIALQDHIKTLQSEHSIPEKEFWETFESMSKELVGDGKVWKNLAEMTPENVVQQVQLNRQYQKVYQAAQKVGLTDEAIIDETFNLTQRYPDKDVEWIAEMIRKSGVLSKTSVENLNRKVSKNGNVQRSQSSANSTKKQNGNGAYTKEELDELYHHAPKGIKSVVSTHR